MGLWSGRSVVGGRLAGVRRFWFEPVKANRFCEIKDLFFDGKLLFLFIELGAGAFYGDKIVR